jgi:hypothetical protein
VKNSVCYNGACAQLAEAVAGKALHAHVITALQSVTKMYVGELVETARMIAHRGGHMGALLPVHVYEAYQLMSDENRTIAPKASKRLFR